MPSEKGIRALSLFLVFLVLASSAPTLNILEHTVIAKAENSIDKIKLVRSPIEVHSGQPVLVLAYAPTGNNVELEVSINIMVKTNSSRLRPPSTTVPTHKIRMLPLPWARGWYVAFIPGLPSKTWTLNLGFRTIKMAIVSKVSYSLIVDGSVIASDNYTVKEGEPFQRLPPLVYSFVYDVIKDKAVINETLGLGPHGWVIGSGESAKIIIVAFDENSRPEVRFEYRVNDGSWITASTTNSSLMNELDLLAKDANEAISAIEKWLKRYKRDALIPRSILSVRIDEATIPPQETGTYVTFRAIASDVDGNSVASPTGFYFVVNKNNNTRILIVDPHVWLWLFGKNVEQISNALRYSSAYNTPTEALSPLRRVREISKIVSEYGLELFHHWEYLGKYYNIYITLPNKNIIEILNNMKPNVIILSDLSLGLGKDGFWDWDLRDITVDGESLLDYLISYIKQYHAGIIVTHATLSDEVIWLNCEVKKKIGAKGHVGYNLEDIDVNNEKTVAALLGIPELALWEYIRDKIAESLCNASNAYKATQPEVAAALESAAILFGSTPLQIPYVPWNGTLEATPEAKKLGWSLPKKFTIEIPSLADSYGFKAFTEVGWQLAFPKVLAYKAWREAFKSRIDFSRLFENRLAHLYGGLANNRFDTAGLSRYFDESLKHVLRDLYRGVNAAQIKGTLINLSVPITENNKQFNLLININKNILYKIIQKMPVKIVALSPDGLAGIIVYDKFWDHNGYRAVYFSFEVEATEGDISEKLLVDAVEWVREWHYKDLTTLIGGVRVLNEIASLFNNVVAKTPGKKVYSDTLIVNEEGASIVELALQPGTLYLFMLHPTTDAMQVEVVEGNVKIINLVKINNYISKATLKVISSGIVKIALKAGSKELLNPVYLIAKFKPYTTVATRTQLTSTPSSVTSIVHHYTTHGNTLLYTELGVVIIIIMIIIILMIKRK